MESEIWGEDEMKGNIIKGIDDILQRIGFGKYQVYMCLLTGGVALTDSAEGTLVGILGPLLKKEWGLEDSEVELLASVVSFGMMIGTVLSGPLTDLFGRKKMLFICSVLNFLFAFSSAFMPELWSFLAMRTLLGVCAGALVPAAISYLIEISTPKTRSGVIVMLAIVFLTGSIMVILLSIVLIPGLNPDHWRELLLIISFPSFLSVIFQYFKLEESPRYLAIYRRFDQAIQVLNDIAKTNGAPMLSTEEMQIVCNVMPTSSLSTKHKLKTIFGRSYLKVSLQLFYLWSMIGLLSFGIGFIAPFTLHHKGEEENVLYYLLLIHSLRLPAVLIAFYMLEKEKFGRKNTLTIASFMAVGLFAVMVYFVGTELFVGMIALAGGLINIIGVVIHPYTCEIYETSVRTTGFAICSLWSRIVCVGVPFVLLPLHGVNKSYPYVFFTAVAGVGFGVCLMLKYETRGKMLDFKVDSTPRVVELEMSQGI
jgi:MFS family permease